MTQPDVLLLEGIGGGYTEATLQTRGLGGSEIEILQVARGLTNRGHSVAIANGVETLKVEDGITYVPHAQAWQHTPRKALYLQRWNTPETRLEIPSDVRVIVRANDVRCLPYEVHRPWLSTGRATLVANTHWQAETFTYAKDRVVIPPMLEPMPVVEKQRGLFVFASGFDKGLEATLGLWRQMKARHPKMQEAILAVVSPGWGEPKRPLYQEEIDDRIIIIGSPTPQQYRHWIAKAEGLFMVNTMTEVFGCVGALAERAGTKVHILCEAGKGGFVESVKNQTYITEDPLEFEDRFIAAYDTWGEGAAFTDDWTPSALIPKWEDVLHLKGRSVPISLESQMPSDPRLAANQEPLGPFFGDFLSLLRSQIAPGGSEFGAGLMLFSLATSIKAETIVEIGRFKGFSTLALAAACHLIGVGWTEPKAAEQRADVNYGKSGKAVVTSIDPNPCSEAEALIEQAGLDGHVDYRNVRSEAFTPSCPIDLLFIDGRHDVAGVRDDVNRFVPWVRPGGYFILHDYYGWFTPEGQNGSPIAQVIAEDLTTCDRLLIDTGYASLVIFRKTQNLIEPWELPAKPSKIPARADGRPTVGLCIIAKGDEASTVATRAIRSGQKVGVDCVTVVCDAQDATADVARSLGADVFVRPTPPIDWGNGYGVIAGARNEALAIAEQRTDYVLVVDADDWLEGTLPSTLDADVYELTVVDANLHYTRLQLFRSALGLRYRGIIHEVLETPHVGKVGKLADVTYRRGQSSYGYQDRDTPQVKFSKHASLAQKWLLDHPDDTRMQFYLARSYQDAGRADEALIAYAKRIDMQGWHMERAYAAYQMGLIQIAKGLDPTVRLLQSHELGKHAEPLVALARWYRDDARKQFALADLFARKAAEIPLPTDGVFTQPMVYQYEAAAEVAIAAYWLGRKQEALERFTALLPKVPADQRKWCEGQIAICQRDLAR